jgi:hypothetical protein
MPLGDLSSSTIGGFGRPIESVLRCTLNVLGWCGAVDPWPPKLVADGTMWRGSSDEEANLAEAVDLLSAALRLRRRR